MASKHSESMILDKDEQAYWDDATARMMAGLAEPAIKTMGSGLNLKVDRVAEVVAKMADAMVEERRKRARRDSAMRPT